MPKIVDHNERRRELIRFAAEYIADNGMDNTSLRKLANAGGFSQNLVAHYFNNKEELLCKVQEFVSIRSIERYQSNKDKSLINVVLQQLPFEREQEVECKVLMNFWTLISHNAELRQNYQRYNTLMRKNLRSAIRAQIDRGTIVETADVEFLADLVLSLSTSLLTHILLDPAYYTRARAKRLVQRTLGEYIRAA